MAAVCRAMASAHGPSLCQIPLRPAVSATTRACWPAREAWSRQASRPDRSALAQASACPKSARTGTAAGSAPSGAGPLWRAMKALARAAACW
jgi:hypothetical protein